MKSSPIPRVRLHFICLLISVFCATPALAQENPLRFQRPAQATETSQQKFRAPSPKKAAASKQQAAPNAPLQPAQNVATSLPAMANTRESLPVAREVKRDSHVRRAQSDEVEFDSSISETHEKYPVEMDSMQLSQPVRGHVIYDSGTGSSYPHMEMMSPHIEGCPCETCICESGCGAYDPGCGMDVGCGIADPACGVPDCGSCVGVPGPDYWCIPLCFPRLKDLTVWGGVHGFRGPRDFIPNGQSNSNFGFQEGVNVSGRAPLVGFLFPELSYQLGFQALQSRLSGTLYDDDERGQQFVTAGLFRRTPAGLQFGAVFDSMSDDLGENIDLNQVRYEISLKTPLGRELGFWGASSTNSAVSNGVTYETTDQFCGFYRWNFKDGYQARLWGGGSGDGEGILGADFYAPLTDRWSLQTGFNYLIPEQGAGPAGVVEESWNLGINLVWHLGRTAKKGCRSPFRPLFPVADNGWMFVDQVD